MSLDLAALCAQWQLLMSLQEYFDCVEVYTDRQMRVAQELGLLSQTKQKIEALLFKSFFLDPTEELL